MYSPFGLGAVVRVVNRVVDSDGKRVPFECMVGGEAFWIKDHLDLPLGVARVAIQQSIYKIDPVTNAGSYRLGCEELGLDTTPVPASDTERVELIDRDLLPPHRQNVKTVRIHNPIRRMDPLSVRNPRPGDNGAYHGEFGESN